MDLRKAMRDLDNGVLSFADLLTQFKAASFPPWDNGGSWADVYTRAEEDAPDAFSILYEGKTSGELSQDQFDQLAVIARAKAHAAQPAK